MTKYDPTPYLRWYIRPVTFTDDKPSVPVLQVGYRPINGGEPHWFDVPTVRASDEKPEF